MATATRDSNIDKIMKDSNIKIITKEKFWLNARDFIHGAFLSIGLSVLTVIQNSFSDGQFSFKWKNVAMVGVGAFITYLIKNFFTPSNTTVQIGNENPKALSASLKEASNISIDKTDGKVQKIETSVG